MPSVINMPENHEPLGSSQIVGPTQDAQLVKATELRSGKVQYIMQCINSCLPISAWGCLDCGYLLSSMVCLPDQSCGQDKDRVWQVHVGHSVSAAWSSGGDYRPILSELKLTFGILGHIIWFLRVSEDCLLHFHVLWDPWKGDLRQCWGF